MAEPRIQMLRDRAVKLVQNMPQAIQRSEPIPLADIKSNVQQRLDAELKTYAFKNPRLAFWLWLLTGWMGGHRYYLEKVGTGLVMTLTAGGMLVWWIIDGFRLRTMVHAFNEEQTRRQAAGEPAIGMEFIPSIDADVSGVPAWFSEKKQNRGGINRRSGILRDVISGTYWNLLVEDGFTGFLGIWIKNMFLNFLIIFGFASPIGATLTKHMLIRNTRRSLWFLSAVTLIFLLMGLGMIG